MRRQAHWRACAEQQTRCRQKEGPAERGAAVSAQPRDPAAASGSHPLFARAQVVITDKDMVLPLIGENIELNGISATPGAGKHCGGRCVLWGAGAAQPWGQLQAPAA